MTHAGFRTGTSPRRRGFHPTRALAMASRQLILSVIVAGCAVPSPADRAGALYVAPAARPQPPSSSADDPNGGAN